MSHAILTNFPISGHFRKNDPVLLGELPIAPLA